MTIYIPKFSPPIEHFCIWGNGFTSEECDSIREIGELAEFSKGRVGEAKGGGDENHEARNSDITWLEPSDQTDWIFQRLASLGSKINFDKFQVELTRFDGVQYTKYGVNQHYNWHTDTMAKPPNPELHRKVSFSIMLTDPKEYEGGELLLAPGGNNEKPISLKREKGDVIAFYSFVPHKVIPVTSGERVSLVTWALGPKFK
jgi:PKHD-type hydroxylase